MCAAFKIYVFFFKFLCLCECLQVWYMLHIYTWALLRLEEDNGSSRTGIIGRSQVTKDITLNGPWNLKGFGGNPVFKRTG